MPINSDLLVLSVDNKIWLDSDSLISYLRNVEEQARSHFNAAQINGDDRAAAAAFSVGDSVRQIADGLVLTTMVASDKIRSRRESGR
jgi:hypothetical protein